MIHRRLMPVLAAFAVAASSLAQLTAQDKAEVLAGMDEVLTESAFVPGVDLGRWRNFIADRQGQIEATESPREFATLVNGALKQFGVSHIRLMPGRMRRGSYLQSPWSSRSRGARLEWIDNETAYVRLADFYGTYDERQVERIFEEAREAGRMVLDLRSNPGGEVGNMLHFLGMLLPSNTSIGTFVTRRMARAYVQAGKGDGRDPVAIATWAKKPFSPRRNDIGDFRGKIAVLVDGASGSASEIVANAMREERRSPIIGTPSAGAVLMSTFSRLPHGFRIQFPISDFVSARGKRLESNPVVPDVRLDPEAGTAEAVEAALARLK
jgi:hypothetical protein